MKSPLQIASLTGMLFIAAIASAGTTGKIAGEVKDSQTGEALIGVSVLVEGTSMGAATNVDGFYSILNVAPGKYNLVVSAVGYHKQTIAGVAVSIDLTTTIDVKLVPTVVEVGEEVVVTAERPLVTKDLTATTAVVGGEDIKALPVTEVSEVLNLQAGMVAGSLRGGRSGEVAYWIDGVPVTDVYDGGQVVEVNKDLVQELQLVSGAFNAEYGQAMSGIVNIATKEGGTKYTGAISTYFGDYLSDNVGIFTGIHKLSNFNPTAIHDYEGNISGPILGDDLTFFANGRYIYFNGWEYGMDKYTPWNVSYTNPRNQFQVVRDSSTGLGSGQIVPMNWSRRTYGQGKLTWRAAATLKATINYIHDYTNAKAFSYSFFLDPFGIGNNHTMSNTAIFQLSHTISASTFYTIGASVFDHDLQYYVYQDPHDPQYTSPYLLTPVDSYSLLSGGTDLNRFHRKTTTYLVKTDLSSQINETNLVKVGVEFRKHRLYYESYTLQPVLAQSAFNAASSSPFISTQIPSESSNSYDSYTHQPIEASAYIQDKMEFRDFILNIGLRFDYFDPDAYVLNDDPNHYTVDDPNIYSPIKVSNISTPLAERFTYWYKKASKKYAFSPRLGASFPITSRGVVHFSYGHFFQIPPFELLYQNPNFKIGYGTGNQGLLGNADLQPEQTISTEIGVQQQLTDDVAVDVTGYFRDIRNLTSTSGDEILVYGGVTSYSKFVNRDFGSVKGIVMTVEKRFAGGISTKADYTYQIARGTGSDPQEYRNAILGGRLPEVQLVPLAWDQRHTLNITFNYSSTQWGASAIGQYGSGTPYTPRSAADIGTLVTNAAVKPNFFNVDLRAYYQIPIEQLRLVAFIRVFNLFDRLNELNVYNDSGSAGYTIDETNAIIQRTPQLVNTVQDFYRRPDFYSEPRRIEFGMNLEF